MNWSKVILNDFKGQSKFSLKNRFAHLMKRNKMWKKMEDPMIYNQKMSNLVLSIISIYEDTKTSGLETCEQSESSFDTRNKSIGLSEKCFHKNLLFINEKIAIDFGDFPCKCEKEFHRFQIPPNGIVDMMSELPSISKETYM
jgi:hypothetical protein